MSRAAAKLDPQAEAALAASMARLAARTAEAEARKNLEIQTKAPTVSGETTAAEPPAVLEPLKAQPPLEWLKPEGMGVRTKCGKYACGKVVLNGTPVYEIWHMVPSGNWFNCIAKHLPSFDEAKRVAQEHARTHP